MQDIPEKYQEQEEQIELATRQENKQANHKGDHNHWYRYSDWNGFLSADTGR